MEEKNRKFFWLGIFFIPLLISSCVKPVNKPPREVYIPNNSFSSNLKPDTSQIDRETIRQLKEIMKEKENGYAEEEKQMEENEAIEKLLNQL